MKQQQFVIIAGLILIGIIFGAYYVSSRLDAELVRPLEPKSSPEIVTNPDCVPTFVDGGGPYYLPNQPFRSILHPEIHQGEILKVSGKILRSDCTTPITGATLDIWHADETGEYIPDWYRGQVTAEADGSYAFETVIPKGYGEGTGYRPPHIHFKVFENGRELITSQMFFPEVAGRAGFDAAYIMKVSKNGDVNEAQHDIILP